MSQTKQDSSDTGNIVPTVIQTHTNSAQLPPSEAELPSHFRSLGWQDGIELLGEALAGVPVAGPAIKKLLEIGTETGKYSPEQRLVTLNWKWLLQQVEEIQNRLDILLEELPVEEQPQPTDVAAVIRAVIKASEKTADHQKRQLLKNALVNAFNREQYQAGLTLRLLSILEDLEYGDIYVLRKILKSEESKNNELSHLDLSSEHRMRVYQVKTIFGNNDLSTASIIFHHIDILESQKLISIESNSDEQNEDNSLSLSKRVYSWQQLSKANIPYIQYGNYIRPPSITQLGKRLLKLLIE